jgi:GNAT superfamily N-acetyltransferase
MTARLDIALPRDDADWHWLADLWRSEWSGETMVTRGRVHRLRDLSALIAREGDRRVGAVTFRVEGDECELLSLNASEPGRGVGGELLEAVEQVALDAGCRRLWLITTNDNLDALRFYQRRGFRLAALHPGAVDRARALKPAIPEAGNFGIPIHDEIELEKWLSEDF